MDKFKIIFSLTKQLLFWVLFFAFTRLIYLVYNYRFLEMEDISFTETLASFYHGLGLDIATAFYFLIFPFFLLFMQSLIKKKWLNQINKYYVLVMVILYSLVTVGELGIYEEWKTKLHYKGLMYLTHPSEIYNSAETGTFFFLVLILISQILLAFWVYRRFFHTVVLLKKRNILFSLAFLVVTPPLMLIGMRGGLQEIPIIQSSAYYSEHNILNLAAMNSGFNLFVSINENYRTEGKNPFRSFSDEEAGLILEGIYETPKDTSIQILSTKRPNIVLLLMESWSADLIESLGGEPGITPGFRELEKDGILFTSVYSSGARSEQGMAAILSSFPAHPISSITVQPDKQQGLPTLTEKLEEKGYHTSFYFGGQLEYGNIKSYILYNGFDKIIEGKELDDIYPKGKLGVHDEFVLNHQLQDLDRESAPFFSTVFTLSTHSPFDMPMEEEKIKWGGHVREYLNSAWYTDNSLYNYVMKAKRSKWYNNTLFIIVADHSHHSYKNNDFFRKDYHHIPLLLYGNVIKPEYRGLQWDKLGTQVDIAKTLLNQMDISSDEFHWGKDLLNPHAPEFANIAFEEGIGWVRPNADFFYHMKLDHFYYKNIPDSIPEQNVIREGRTFLQEVFREYLEY